MDYGRQLDIFDPAKFTDNITVVGAGGIGSPTVVELTKMGCRKMVVYDADKIEIHNLPSQFYRQEDVGKEKVLALKEIVASFSGVDLVAKPEFYTDQQFDSGIVISAVDKMEQRQIIWKKVKMNPRIKLFIDARMGGEVARVYAINPLDIDEIAFYEKTLYSDAEAVPTRCTAKAIMFNVFAIAFVIGVIIRKYASGQPIKKEVLLDMVNLAIISR